jgi:hypothetical protein
MTGTYRLQVDTLTLERSWDRPGPNEGGSGYEYMDYVVNGASLSERFANTYGAPKDVPVSSWFGHVTMISKNWVAPALRRDLQMLTGRVAGELPSGRVPLYVCRACADVDCGCYAARITVGGGSVVWADFASEPVSEDGDEIASVGPFEFEQGAYTALIEGAFADLRPWWRLW